MKSSTIWVAMVSASAALGLIGHAIAESRGSNDSSNLSSAATTQAAPQSATPTNIPAIGSGMMTYYPERARRLGITGSVRLTCTITEEGRLTSCTTSDETPQNFGFAKSALYISQIFRMPTRTAAGVSTAGNVYTTKIRFQIPKH